MSTNSFKNKFVIITIADVEYVLDKYHIRPLLKSIDQKECLLTIKFRPVNKKNVFTLRQKRNIKNFKRYFIDHMVAYIECRFYKETE